LLVEVWGVSFGGFWLIVFYYGFLGEKEEIMEKLGYD